MAAIWQNISLRVNKLTNGLNNLGHEINDLNNAIYTLDLLYYINCILNFTSKCPKIQ